MNNDLRQQILVSLRAEGVGEADKAREALAHVSAEVQRVTKSFIDGTTEAAEFKKEVTALGGQLKFFGDIVKSTEQQVGAIDVGLHKLQVTALKFGDDYQAAMAKAAQAAEDLAIKQADDFAKAAATHEAFLAREAAAADAAAIKKADLLAREIAAEIAADEKTAASDADAVMKEEQRFNRMMADRQAYLAKAAAADAAAALKEEQRTDKLLADHEAKEAKEAAAAEASAVKKADILAREVAAELAAAAKIEAANAEAVMKEEQRFNRMMADRQKYLEKDAAERQAKLLADHKAFLKLDADAAKFVSRDQNNLDQLLEMGRVVEATAPKYNKLTEAKKKGAEASNQFGYGVLHVSHAFQDLQYGMAAAINNVPLIVTAFGGGAGLAGGLMSTAVAAQILSNHIDVDMRAAFTGIYEPTKIFTGTVAGLQEKIKELNDNPMKFGADAIAAGEATQEVKELQRAYEAMNAAKEGKTVHEKQAGDEFSQAFAAEGPRGGQVMGLVKGQFAKHLLETSLTLKEQEKIIVGIDAQMADLDKMYKAGGDLDTMAAIADRHRILTGERTKAVAKAGEIREKIIGPEGEAAGMAGNLLTGAQAGNNPEARAELARRFRQAGAPDLANVLEATTPEEMEAQDAVEQRFDSGVAGIKARFDKIRSQDKAAKKAATKKKAEDTKRAQRVQQQANLFGGQFDDDIKPGSLDAAILHRAGRQGQTAEKIQGDLSKTMAGRLAGKVPPDLVDDVAAAIVKKAVDKVRAEVAAAGGGQAAIDAVEKERVEKLGRAAQADVNRADAAANRQGREQVGAQEMGMAQDIFQQAGGQLNEAGAMAAAHRAMQAIKGGANQQRAMWQGMIATFNDIAQDQARAQMQLNGMHGQINGLQGQVRRNRAQRPGLLPQFPQ